MRIIPYNLLLLCCIAAIPLLSACYESPILPRERRKEAYVPIYGVDTALRKIESRAPQPTVKAGKIYVFGKYLFQVEADSGVHVINYADKNHPVKISFIKSIGCSEIAVRGNYLITNNRNDLVSIDISDLAHVKETARIPKAFKNYHFGWNDYKRPPEKDKFYVCPDLSQGDVIGWKLEKKVAGAYCLNN